MSFNLNVVSFNVGCERDWNNLHSRSLLNTRFKPENIDTAEKKNLFFKQLKGKDSLFTKQEMLKRHNALVNTKLNNLISEFEPDVFCLQEYRNLETHKSIKTVLEKNGYTLLADEQDLAIAYKTNKFVAQGPLRPAFDGSNSTAQKLGVSDYPAKYVDLVDKATHKTVRVVTDHPAGFDGAEQKEATAKRKTTNEYKKTPLGETLEERVKYYQEDRNARTISGDAALDLSLDAVTNDEVDFIVYGLDANTTSKTVSYYNDYRLHPKRMRLFDLYQYVTDPDRSPTIRDGNSARPVKYDYIAAKDAQDDFNTEISTYTRSSINDQYMLDQPELLMSDHLPVVASITFKPTKPIGKRDIRLVQEGKLKLSTLTERIKDASLNDEDITRYSNAIEARKEYESKSWMSWIYSLLNWAGFGQVAKAEKMLEAPGGDLETLRNIWIGKPSANT